MNELKATTPVSSTRLLDDCVEQLKTSEKESKELGERMAALHQRQYELKIQIAKIKHGVEVGTIVVKKDGSEYRVTKVDVRWVDRPWLEGNPRKKDGTFGTAIRNLYDDWVVKSSNVRMSDGK